MLYLTNILLLAYVKLKISWEAHGKLIEAHGRFKKDSWKAHRKFTLTEGQPLFVAHKFLFSLIISYNYIYQEMLFIIF